MTVKFGSSRLLSTDGTHLTDYMPLESKTLTLNIFLLLSKYLEGNVHSWILQGLGLMLLEFIIRHVIKK
jgi:hypothetical protein